MSIWEAIGYAVGGLGVLYIMRWELGLEKIIRNQETVIRELRRLCDAVERR